jgi:hypothetical protein
LDDYLLAILLLVIGVPRVILAALYDRPLGVEGTLSIICVVLLRCSCCFAAIAGRRISCVGPEHTCDVSARRSSQRSVARPRQRVTAGRRAPAGSTGGAHEP